MPSLTTYKVNVTIERVENKHLVLSQQNGPDGSLITHSSDEGWFAVIREMGISIRISDTDPRIKAGTRASLQLVVPTE